MDQPGTRNSDRPGRWAHSLAGPVLLGFTVLEVVLVIAIAGTLAAISVPGMRAYRLERDVRQALADLRSIDARVASYTLTRGRPPADLAAIGRDGLRDPWGHRYVYRRLSDRVLPPRTDKFRYQLNKDYDLYSLGPDGRSSPLVTASESRDDIVRAGDGAFFGPGRDY